jgi:diguanylate cyclase (GGDEF)-like protein
MAHYLALLFGAGGVLGHLSLLAPHDANVDETAVRIASSAAFPAVLVLAVLGPRLSRAAIHVLLGCGTLIITAGVYYGGQGIASATTAIFYVWVVLYAFTFFRPAAACGHLASIVVLYTTELVVAGRRESISQGIIVVGTVLVTGYVVGRLAAHNTQLAGSDPLTGLPNRRTFDRVLAYELGRAGRVGPVCIAVLDLDSFKHVNDTLGHTVGDELLKVCARRLLACLRPEDVVARLGGDEFAVVVDGARPGTGELVARRVLAALAEPVSLHDQTIVASASVGIAYSTPGTTPADLLRNADLAMYVAKASHPGGYEVYEESMHERALERLQLEADLRDAVAHRRIDVEYQPIVAIGDGQVRGVEALARWSHPVRGAVPPQVFIPIAERTGIIGELGQQVFDHACRTAAKLHATRPDLDVTVNLSPVQLSDTQLAARFAESIRTAGVDPARFILEVTESALVQDVETAATRLRELKEIGVRVAVDDFGVGHSSLSHLRNFPVDILKIDKSFIDALPQGGGQLARALIQMGELLGLDVIAEGIEHQSQLDELRVLGCEHGQGYLFATPMRAPLLLARLARDAASGDAAPAPLDAR